MLPRAKSTQHLFLGPVKFDLSWVLLKIERIYVSVEILRDWPA